MTSFHERFKGRAAIITGGASGVGFDTAKRLVAEGGSVAIWDRDPQALARARAALGGAERGAGTRERLWIAVP